MDLKQSWIQFQIKFADFFVKRYYFVVILTLLLIFGLTIPFILLPKYRIYNLQKNVELPQLNDQLRIVEAKLGKLQTQEVEFTKFLDSEQVVRLSNFLPSQKDIENLFVMLEAIPKENNFQVLNINISEDLATKIRVDSGTSAPQEIVINKLRANLNISGGGYSSLKKVISVFENSLRLMDINSISFSPNLQGSTMYSITLTTYYIEE